MKYELIKLQPEHKLHGTGVNYQIRSLKSFLVAGRKVEIGDLGGFVKDHLNLSHKGRCWIFDDACVYSDARVEEQGVVRDRGKLRHRACVRDKGIVEGDARVLHEAQVTGDGRVRDYSCLQDFAIVTGEGELMGHAVISRRGHLDFGVITSYKYSYNEHMNYFHETNGSCVIHTTSSGPIYRNTIAYDMKAFFFVQGISTPHVDVEAKIKAFNHILLELNFSTLLRLQNGEIK